MASHQQIGAVASVCCLPGHRRFSLVGQRKEELGETALGRGVVAQDWGEGGVA